VRSYYTLTVASGGHLGGTVDIKRSDYGLFTSENLESVELSEHSVEVFKEIYPTFKQWSEAFGTAKEKVSTTKLIKRPFAFIWDGRTASLGFIRETNVGDQINRFGNAKFVESIKYCVDQIPEMQKVLKTAQKAEVERIQASTKRIEGLTKKVNETGSNTNLVDGKISSPNSTPATAIVTGTDEKANNIPKSFTEFISLYIKHYVSDNAADTSKDFAQSCYYGDLKRNVTRDFILRELSKLNEKYPKREYSNMKVTNVLRVADDLITASYTYDYDYTGTKSAKGTSKVNISVSNIAGAWQIISFSEQVDRR
jgi:hypothetical protein